MLRSLFLVLFLLVSGSASAQLTLPKNVIAFNSAAGQVLFEESQFKTAFWSLMPYFTTERGLSWCAVASDVMALNALKFALPLTPQHAPYAMFTQNNFFNSNQVKIVIPALVYARGITLAQDAKLLESYGAKVKLVFANMVTEKQFRTEAQAAVASNNQVILVNFCRKDIHEVGCGHFSPLAAYNAKTDRFLLLDVARYKYPPVWVKTSALYQAMDKGLDSSSKLHRGYVIVSH